jgi:hypothetical protein
MIIGLTFSPPALPSMPLATLRVWQAGKLTMECQHAKLAVRWWQAGKLCLIIDIQTKMRNELAADFELAIQQRSF